MNAVCVEPNVTGVLCDVGRAMPRVVTGLGAAHKTFALLSNVEKTVAVVRCSSGNC